MASYWIGLGFFYTTGQISWRFPVAGQCIFTFAMWVVLPNTRRVRVQPYTDIRLAGMIAFRVPESPRWLASKGRHAEAIAVLAALDGVDVYDPKVQQTWRGIVDSIRHSAGEFAIKELITGGKGQHLRRTLLGMASQWFQQISGIKWVSLLSSTCCGFGLCTNRGVLQIS